MTIEVLTHGSAKYQQTVQLRLEVLRAPLGLDFTDEELAAEADQIHFAAFRDGVVVACLVFVVQPGGVYKMRQVAVRPELQGSGIGRALVDAAEAWARAQGGIAITMHARDTAIPFYERLGYSVEGQGFEEVTIPHHVMTKRLCSL